MSSVWNFCRSVVDVPPRETSPAGKSKEKRSFSQANVSADILIVCQSTYQSSVRVVLTRVSGETVDMSTEMSKNSQLTCQTTVDWGISHYIDQLSVICQ